ncbi:MAG: hypothetical protein RIM23_20650 [Coleofasciculus sp. G3-WIS-01]
MARLEAGKQCRDVPWHVWKQGEKKLNDSFLRAVLPWSLGAF